MSRLGQGRKNLKKPSSTTGGLIKVRIKLQGSEFEASGNGKDVTQQFQNFMALMTKLHVHGFSHDATTESQEDSFSMLNAREMAPTLPFLLKIFENDHRSSALIYRSPPPADEPDANLILMLLLGYQNLRQMNDVPVTVLNHALARSSRHVLRLDRALKTYIAARFVMKRGRGKGGFYRLTGLGIKKASEKVRELATLLPPCS